MTFRGVYHSCKQGMKRIGPNPEEVEVTQVTCPVSPAEEFELTRFIEDIEMAGIKLQYIAASVDCEETNASPGRQARLKGMLLRAGACALEVAVEVLGKISEREIGEARDWL